MAEASQDTGTPKRPRLSNEQKGRFMAMTGADVRTIEKYWQGGRVMPMTRRALDGACRRLGLELPVRTETDVTRSSGENGPDAA